MDICGNVSCVQSCVNAVVSTPDHAHRGLPLCAPGCVSRCGILKATVQLFACRKAIPLNKNEGVYVRNLISGQVRCEMGPQAYLLQAHEQLYKKDLTPLVEEILK